MNRTQFQQLSAERIEDARALLAAGQWSGAYYLAGYALELALKSCILAYIEQTGIIFENKQYAQKCWTHDAEVLVRQAGFSERLYERLGTDLDFNESWTTAKLWSESSRYDRFEQWQAERLLDALTDPTDGVLPWVRNFW